MFAFFDSILGFLNNAWEIVLNFIKTLGYALLMVNTSLSVPIKLVGYLPAIVGSAMLVYIAVYVVKFMLGR